MGTNQPPMDQPWPRVQTSRVKISAFPRTR